MENLKANKTVWRLKSGSDRRFRGGHPWVYSNELQESPKGIEPGGGVELCDAGGKFLARGYGNPASLIAFRTLSRDPSELNPLSTEGILWRLQRAQQLRKAVGIDRYSHRLCFGEADQLPGLIIDLYKTGKNQVIAVQAHTAGMDLALPQVLEALEKLFTEEWPHTAVVLRNDLSVRKLEGVEEKPAEVIKPLKQLTLEDCAIDIAGAQPGSVLKFHTDLVEGQKTGFFLDQSANISLLARSVQGWSGKVKILDLCSYVGQWGAKLAASLKTAGAKVHVVAVDASKNALDFSKKNVEAQGAQFESIRGDVLNDLEKLPAKEFDIIISDPPAFIKGRKAIPQGTHAYLQLNTQVFRMIKPGGFVAACSCSALLEEEEFLKTLTKAAHRNQVQMSWFARGTQAPDHPVLAEFPEGRYLKAWFGQARS